MDQQHITTILSYPSSLNHKIFTKINMIHLIEAHHNNNISIHMFIIHIITYKNSIIIINQKNNKPYERLWVPSLYPSIISLIIEIIFHPYIRFSVIGDDLCNFYKFSPQFPSFLPIPSFGPFLHVWRFSKTLALSLLLEYILHHHFI